MSTFPKFTGNCPRNVAKDAKYAIRSGRSGPVVALVYRAKMGERWLATTEDHRELVQMVNAVKRAYGDSQHGPFYINEYQQVLVPVGRGPEYYLAGEYDRQLVFEFEGKQLSGDAVDLDGRRLELGDEWEGPHPGIPYVLAAGGKDIYYDVEVRPKVTRRVTLSEAIGAARAVRVAGKITGFKGWQGGRFYVNEWRNMFAPISEAGAWKYVYLGPLVIEDGWFPRPAPAEA